MEATAVRLYSLRGGGIAIWKWEFYAFHDQHNYILSHGIMNQIKHTQTYIYIYIYVYNGGQNNGNTKDWGMEFVLATLKEHRWQHWMFFFALFKLCSACTRINALVSWVTVRVKGSGNWRLVKFWKRKGHWCAFSWSIYEKNCHIIRCVKSDRL
jgi:hypothetical protein